MLACTVDCSRRCETQVHDDVPDVYQGLWRRLSCELPVCHRQTRASEPGHTAQYNHAEDPAGASCQPEPNLLACAVAQPCCLSCSSC